MPPSRGRPEEHSDEEFLQAIRDADSPVVGTNTVSESLGVSQRTAYDRLDQLADEGRVGTTTVGQAKVWWVADTVFSHDALFTAEQEARIRRLINEETTE